MIRALVFCLMLPGLALAQGDPGEQALLAAAALEDASTRLDEAQGARDRVRALTDTIQAFEQGLAAMRSGLRQVAIRESQLSAQLASRDGEVAALLSVLLSIGGTPGPTTFLHPDGPTGTARAGMLLAELTPSLNSRADALRRDLEEVQTLRTLQSDAAARLQRGLNEVQNARTALNQAMANRTDLPMRFTEDPVRTGILIASTETLDGFASGLSQMVTDETAPAPATLDGEIGDLPLPVQGLVLRGAGEADAAGITRPGIIVATRPRAIVTTPTAATIRYAGPLLDLGNVLILEPQANALFVLAGLDVVYGGAGQVIEAGTPVGLMGDAQADSGDGSSPLREGGGRELTETLYIEVRQDDIPQDPQDWFRTDKDG